MFTWVDVCSTQPLCRGRLYSRHFVASRINAPAVLFTLDHIVTTPTTMGWTKSLLYHLIVPATRRTTMGAGPRLRRRSTARLEQSARRDPSQPISGHVQTLSENILLYSVLLLASFLITFEIALYDIVKCP